MDSDRPSVSGDSDVVHESDDDERKALMDTATSSSSQEIRARAGRRKALHWSEVSWVILTSALIAILGYSSQLCIIWPYYRSTPSFSQTTLWVVLTPFNVALGLIFWNYFLCVSTNPGWVPTGWEPDWSALDPVDSNAAPLHLKQVICRPRYCKTCAAYKPPRAHHCKTCGKCVLRMDHHCPWVANCVGFHNYPHFIRFLFWVDVSCSYHLVLVTLRVLDKFNDAGYWRQPSTPEVVWMVVNYTLCIPVVLLVGGFSCYHFYCIATNQTTIESWEKDRVQTMIRRGKIRKVRYPYHLGTWHNVVSMLGSNPFLWCLPLRTIPDADGLTYDVAHGIGKSSSKRDCAHGQQQFAMRPIIDERPCSDDDELAVDPELETSVLHRLRWERSTRSALASRPP